MVAIHDALSLLLARADRALARRVGVPASVLASLRWIERPRATSNAGLRIGLAGRARGLPVSLRCPRTGEDVAVEWVADSSAARAQSWLRMENVGQPAGAGTLCAVLRDPAALKLYALTAGHVLAGNPAARFLDNARVTQPFPSMSIDGTVWNYSPDFDARGQDVPFDASLMQVDASQLELLVDALPLPLGWGDALAATQLYLLTRQQWLMAAPVSVVSTAIDGGDPPQRYFLRDVLCYQVDAGCEPGDSGAPVWDQAERLVAMHAGSAAPGSSGNAIASPIRPVLEWATFELVKRNEALLPEGRGLAGVAPVRAPVPAPASPATSTSAAPVDVDTLARTMWGEARNQGPAGLRAVGQTVLNRVDAGSWWGRDVQQVCLKPMQYSCWNSGDPNRSQVLSVTSQDAIFAQALEIARDLLVQPDADRMRTDDTNGATHYFAENLVPVPDWARGRTPCARIGQHVFYRGIA